MKKETTGVKLREVVNGLDSINNIATLKLPVFTSFKISLFLKNINPIIDTYEQERNKLIKECGVPVVEDGKETGNYTFPDGKAAEFNEKIKDVLEADLGVAVPEIKIADLGDIQIEPSKLIPIMWLIKE
jgi:hypothetical protein